MPKRTIFSTKFHSTENLVSSFFTAVFHQSRSQLATVYLAIGFGRPYRRFHILYQNSETKYTTKGIFRHFFRKKHIALPIYRLLLLQQGVNKQFFKTMLSNSVPECKKGICFGLFLRPSKSMNLNNKIYHFLFCL